MQCPQCREPMVIYELDGVELDSCLRCGGVWLDAGELETLGNLSGIAPGPLAAALMRVQKGKRGARRCPRCRRAMLPFDPADDGALMLDRCPRGDGLWFDRGELGLLLQKYSANNAEAAAVRNLLGNMFQYELGGNPGH
jgi:Zn-finger nucleic acid-binding protein